MVAAVSPTALPLVPRLKTSAIEQTWRFLSDPLPLVVRGRAECGDVFSVRVLGLGDWVFVCSPEAVADMVHVPTEDLVAGEIIHRIFSGLVDQASVVTIDGPAHIERRRLMQPQFRDEQIQRQLEVLERVARGVVDAWPHTEPVRLLDQLREISFRSVMETMFGLDATDPSLTLPNLVRHAVHTTYASPLLWVPPLQVDLGPWSPWGRILGHQREVSAAMDAFIAARKTAPDLEDRDDLLSYLLRYQRRHPERVSDRSLSEELLMLALAGYDTFGFVGSWMIECLLSYPDALARARAEVDEVTGGEPVRHEHLPRLSYLEALMHEAIRHRMPSPFAGVRLAKRDLAIRGHRVPAGSMVSMSLAALGMREETFPEPERFRPERFLERKPTPFEWNPFGSGTRQCIGRQLAVVQLKITLATILSRVDLTPIHLDHRRERSGSFFVPRNGLRVRVARRAPRAAS